MGKKLIDALFSDKEKIVLKYTLKPYVICSIVNIVLIILSGYGVGNLNDDFELGVFTCWMIQSLTFLLFVVG